MKNNLHFGKSLKVMVTGVAVATAACTFTACDKSENEIANPNTTAQVEPASDNGAVIPGRYIVVFKSDNSLRISPDASYDQKVKIVKGYATDVLRTRGIQEEAIVATYASAITGMAVDLSAEAAMDLQKDERIAFVEPDRMIMLGKPSSSGGGSTAGQQIPYGISRVGYASGAGKTAWIIDTGVDMDHPDLNVDASRSVSMIGTNRDNTPDDNNGHGTHVAGTVGAKNNTIGVVGVAYGATIVAVKVLDHRGSGAYSGVIAGVDYVAANASTGDAVNMSLGGPVSQALDNAVANAASKGIKFALAAGNESQHGNNSSPGRVNGNNIYTISAMDNQNKFAYFSNYGNPPVDYCAPGVNITSTWKDGGYNTISGTSMASPHVCGLLLIGAINTDGYVSGDPDGNPDPIAHH